MPSAGLLADNSTVGDMKVQVLTKYIRHGDQLLTWLRPRNFMLNLKISQNSANILVEFVDLNPYCKSKDLDKFLNFSKNTFLRRFAGFGYRNKLAAWTPHNQSPNHEREWQCITKLLLDYEHRCSFTDRITTSVEKWIMWHSGKKRPTTPYHNQEQAYM